MTIGYRCALDQAELQAVSGASGILRCPTCGHRTDESGAGVLGDGFDVTPGQWGLRGDVHAWQEMRELLAEVPTPGPREDVRRAYVDALRHVVDVDLDQTDEQQVYRAELDHGGMSGGGVDLGWWRNEGIPLLVERATARRPADGPAPAPRNGPRSFAVAVIVWGLVMLIPAALIGGGTWLLIAAAYGTHVQATVVDCDLGGGIVRGASTYSEDCTATWTIDGRVATGAFIGGNGQSDVGQTVDATVRGDVAYSRSLGLPVLLLVLGLPFLIIPFAAIRGRRRRAASDPEPTSVARGHCGAKRRLKLGRQRLGAAVVVMVMRSSALQHPFDGVLSKGFVARGAVVLGDHCGALHGLVCGDPSQRKPALPVQNYSELNSIQDVRRDVPSRGPRAGAGRAPHNGAERRGKPPASDFTS